MKRRRAITNEEEERLPIEKELYTFTWYVYLNKGGYYDYWHLESSADSLPEAEKIAVRFRHVGKVKIEERLSRTVRILSQTEVCDQSRVI